MSFSMRQNLRKRRRSVLIAMGFVIGAFAAGFGFVVYPWGMLLVPDLDVWTLLKEIYPLAALLLLTILFLADTIHAVQRDETEESAAQPAAGADPSETSRLQTLAEGVCLSLDRLASRAASATAALPGDAPLAAEVRAIGEDLCGEAQRTSREVRGILQPEGGRTDSPR